MRTLEGYFGMCVKPLHILRGPSQVRTLVLRFRLNRDATVHVRMAWHVLYNTHTALELRENWTEEAYMNSLSIRC